MPITPPADLIDLDELVDLCRDEQARTHIEEAVACCRAGAYRACIVATWNALVFDYLRKLQELELTGDAEARIQCERFESIRSGGDSKLGDALQFERDMLDTASEKFELLTPHELRDLERLHMDRNRCAHPSMQSLEEPYIPSAELARTHLRNAVEIMLEREPVQGKAAFDRICMQVKSAYFPQSPEQAREQLETGPLSRARSSLVRSLFVGFTKEALIGKCNPSEKRRIIAAVGAIVAMYPARCEEHLRGEFPRMASGCPDDNLWCLVEYFESVPGSWEASGSAIQAKITSYVETVNEEDLSWALSGALKVPALAKTGRRRLVELTADGVVQLVSNGVRKEIEERAVDLFIDAGSFRQAEHLGRALMLPIAKTLNADLVKKAVRGAAENGQIWFAAESPAILASFYELTRPTLPETGPTWQAFVKMLDKQQRRASIGDHYAYADLRRAMESDGWWPPEDDETP